MSPTKFAAQRRLLSSVRRSSKMDEKDRLSSGMKTRRAVLGDAYVDKAVASTTNFNADFQDLITRYAWGDVWSRPGLTHPTRSLLTIAMMVALHHTDELRVHLRAALNNGVSPDEIKETLLQCAVYCGVPAANHAFRLAQDVFAEIDARPS
jgi:4-carboxymuconolactone decarboxylase